MRGFALFGILLVNMDAYAWPITENRLGWYDSVYAADRVAGWLIRLLAQGKFFTLFSLLFGIGLAIQMTRAEARGARFLPTYLRRLVVLLGFGLLHINLLWAGDILTDYAILGLALLLFRRCRPVVLIRWSAAALAVSVALTTLLVWPVSGLTDAWFGSSAPPPAASARDQDRSGSAPRSVLAEADRTHRAIDIYRRGTFAEMRALRLLEVRELQLGGITFEPIAFAMFLLGLSVGRSRILETIPEHLPRLARFGVWGAGVGVAANLAFALLGDHALGTPTVFADWAGGIGFIIGGPVLMLTYAAGLVVLLQRPVWRARFAALAAAGRMPLTNYLMQSVICTTIFYGYGFRLFGRVGIAAGVGLAVAIYLGQIGLSVWWIRRFEFGPLEWVWRALSYGHRISDASLR